MCVLFFLSLCDFPTLFPFLLPFFVCVFSFSIRVFLCCSLSFFRKPHPNRHALFFHQLKKNEIINFDSPPPPICFVLGCPFFFCVCVCVFLFLFRKAARTETEKTLTKNTSESYPYLTILQSKMQYKKQRPKITHENQTNYKQKYTQKTKYKEQRKKKKTKL